MKQTIYDILPLFTDPCNTIESLRRPFSAGGYVCATNNYAIIYISNLADVDKYPELAEQYMKNFILSPSFNLRSGNLDVPITIHDLEQAFSQLPLVSEEVVTREGVACKECGGDGTVEWEYRDKSYNLHTEEFECPMCNGSGYSIDPVSTVRKGISPDTSIRIGCCSIAYKFLSVLQQLMQHLSLQSITLYAQKDSRSYFRISDDITIVIAGTLKLPEFTIVDENYMLHLHKNQSR